MHIERLSLVNFKNYEQVELDLHNKLNCFVGDNGVGKTNLLDAVFYLCMCKSYFNASDAYNMRYDTDFMILQGDFFKQGQTDELYCGLKKGQKKHFRRNKKEYSRLSDHIGLYPVVMVSPADSALILEGSEERRRYMNSVISQYDKNYLEQVMRYNKVLAQRNKLLKERMSASQQQDLLDIYDSQLTEYGKIIFEARKQFVEQLIPVFQKYYSFISGGKEKVELEYTSQLHQNEFGEALKNVRKKDQMIQHTSVGIHKDDLVLKMQGISIKRVGSQGQQKTYLVAMKLAQFEFLAQVKEFRPVLLLDDIFDKFDTNRVKKLLELVSDETFGQIFITHTNEERMLGLLQNIDEGYSIFRVQNNELEKVE